MVLTKLTMLRGRGEEEVEEEEEEEVALWIVMSTTNLVKNHHHFNHNLKCVAIKSIVRDLLPFPRYTVFAYVLAFQYSVGI